MTREKINGHWYMVERDSSGRITKQIGNDEPVKIVDDEYTANLRSLIKKDPREWNNADTNGTLQFLLRKAL